MKTIYYSLCGEGLGHATRALAISNTLPANYIFFTYGQAYTYLSNLGLNVIKINGLKFSYNDNGSINNPKTVLSAIKFICSQNYQFRGSPDLCISDWEPTLYRFSREKSVPLIEIASQYKFRFPKDYSFSWKFFFHSQAISLMSRFYKADSYIVPSFQFEKIIKSNNVHPVFGFINQNLKREENKGYLLAYAHNYETLSAIKIRFGLSYRNDIIEFGPKSNKNEFHKYLVGADRVACGAGTQLISECASLGIPIHIYPIKNQYEQIINGNDAQDLGIGIMENYNSGPYDMLPNNFTNKYLGMNGVTDAVNIIKEYL